MRLIMMGTGGFAVPTLRALYESPHQVMALVTRPLRIAHGKTQAEVNPMREVAILAGTPVLEPESVNTDAVCQELETYEPDLLVVCDYGQILSPATLQVARLGGINLHASLLPKYRGAAPINWAIYRGETETGVTVIHMTPRIDAGPAIAQARVAIGADETAIELEPRLAALGAPLILKCIDLLEVDEARPIPQDPAQATRAPRLRKTDGLVDWSRSSEALRNQVRALVPWPTTYSFWVRPAGEPLRLILTEVAVGHEPRPENVVPGEVVEAAGDRLTVATGDGLLAIQRIQPAGKRVLSAAEFLRGYPVRPGQKFGIRNSE
jgi:methionyl-tRNA formyltransferase